MITFNPFFLGVDIFMTLFFVLLFFNSKQRDNRIIFAIAIGMWGALTLGQLYLAFFGPIHV